MRKSVLLCRATDVKGELQGGASAACGATQLCSRILKTYHLKCVAIYQSFIIQVVLASIPVFMQLFVGCRRSRSRLLSSWGFEPTRSIPTVIATAPQTPMITSSYFDFIFQAFPRDKAARRPSSDAHRKCRGRFRLLSWWLTLNKSIVISTAVQTSINSVYPISRILSLLESSTKSIICSTPQEK